MTEPKVYVQKVCLEGVIEPRRPPETSTHTFTANTRLGLRLRRGPLSIF